MPVEKVNAALFIVCVGFLAVALYFVLTDDDHNAASAVLAVYISDWAHKRFKQRRSHEPAP